MMEAFSRVVFGIASATLMLLALGLVAYGASELISAMDRSWHDGGDAVLSAIGFVVIAMAVFDVAKFFMEEEVVRGQGLPTAFEARRSLTKFISTIAMAVFIEGLVTVFQVSKQNVEKMLYPTALLATIVVGLGLYQRLNVGMEHQIDKKTRPPKPRANMAE
jgi:hypothetical protein